MAFSPIFKRGIKIKPKVEIQWNNKKFSITTKRQEKTKKYQVEQIEK